MRLETVLSTSLVLAGTRLLNNMAEVNDFRSRSEIGEIVVAVAGSVGGTIQESGYILELGKERITLELFASRSSIKKEFPSGREELSRVAAVAQTAIDASNVENRPPEGGRLQHRDGLHPTDSESGLRVHIGEANRQRAVSR